MESLYIIHGNDQGTRYELPFKEVTIGRNPDNMIQLHDREVSRNHAIIRLAESGRILCDQKSSNGVFLNGTRIQEEELHNGDQIQIGGTMFLYSVSSEKSEKNSKIAMVKFQDVPRNIERSKIVHSLYSEHDHGFFSPNHSDNVNMDGPANAQAHLNLMYHTTLVVSQTLDINHLLQRIMDLIFEWVLVDRGCILLYDTDSNKLIPQVSKDRTSHGNNNGMTISRTILDYVIRTNEGVLTSDAQSDERWNAEESILDQGIKEAICVPMQGRYGLTGVIYIDTTVFWDKTVLPTEELPTSVELEQNSAVELSPIKQSTVQEPPTNGNIKKEIITKLTLDHLKLMMAIGHQAALAVEDTYYYQSMVQGERLAAVGQTVAVLSHHIKNILQGINGGGYLIDQGLKTHDEGTIHKGWSIVEKNQNRISDLIMDMLTFSKERVPFFDENDLNTTIVEVIELMQGRANELKVDLEFIPDPSVIPFYFDKEQIHRAITNLVSNALDAVHDNQLKHDEDQETLTSGFNDYTEKGKVLIQTLSAENCGTIIVTVDDNGKGVPLEMKDSLFRPFFSKNKSMGTGIGLAVTHKIIEEHKGHIDIEKSPLGGARFKISLPFLREKPEIQEET